MDLHNLAPWPQCPNYCCYHHYTQQHRTNKPVSEMRVCYRLVSNIRCTSYISRTPTLGNSQLEFSPTISLAKTSDTRRTPSFDSDLPCFEVKHYFGHISGMVGLIDSCDRPSNLTQIGFYAMSNFVHHFISICKFKIESQSRNAQFGSKLAIFCPMWPWNLMDDLEKQQGTFSVLF